MIQPNKQNVPKKNSLGAVITRKAWQFKRSARVGIKNDIEDAIKVHGAWKARFRDFLSGKAGLELSGVGHTDACKLGMWLGDGGRRMLSPEDHARACELHAQFHRVAGEIVHNIKQKDFMAARQALTAAGAFDQASHELGAFLRKVALRGRHKVANQETEDEATTEPAGMPPNNEPEPGSA